MSFNKISVIGLGYIGLPTAAMFASRKVQVIGVDVNQNAVETINRGEIHIIEPDLDVAVQSAVNEGYLRASTTPEAADAFIIAVPTPFKEEHRPDLSYIEAAAKAIAPVLEKGNLVILESTSPVGATEKLAKWISDARPDLAVAGNTERNAEINVSHCPERVLPGHVMRELIENDRIIGGLTKECSKRSVALYEIFVKGDCLTTNARTAEMSKLTENSFRDVNIAFANELSMICDEQGIDVWELISLANRHPRVNILRPGCGVGGHCIAVDPWFIVDSSPDSARLIRAAREVNDTKPEWVVHRIFNAALRREREAVICFGLSFKPDIDDLRESPAVQIVKSLHEKGLNILVVEPNIDALPADLRELGVELISLSDVAMFPNAVCAMLVAHTPFQSWYEARVETALHCLDFCGLSDRS